MQALRSRLAALVILVSLAGSASASAIPTPVLGQDATVDALMASLLQPEDLPPGFTTLGPEEGSPLDIDSGAFSQAGGRRVVSQAWSSPTSGVVFDFRMEMPSPEAAARYLEEAEVTLSEADVTGLSLVTDDPAIGERPRHYSGVTRVGDAAITFDNYLFHVGPVAAKVFVGSVELPAGEAHRLAEVAVERMAGFATEHGAATSAIETPDVRSGTPARSAGPDTRLAAHVPASLLSSCRPFDSRTAGEVEALSCAVGDDLIVYSGLSDAAALADAFEAVTSAMPSVDLAGSCAQGPFSGPYTVGSASGDIACWDPPGDGLVLFWTDDARLVLGAILAETDDPGDLDAAWQAALLR